MRIAPRIWLTGLAAIVAALSASPVHVAGTAGLSSARPHVRPLPAASWHGRPIRDPQPGLGAAALASASRGAPLPPLRLGAGYGRPRGSGAVRKVQRLLSRIGYRCGPVDGLFGPRTRASVQWFQIKHGLRPTGVVGRVTLAFLRLRAAGEALPHGAGSRGSARPVGRTLPARHASPARSAGAGQHWTIFVPLAGAGVLALVGWAPLRRRRRTPAPAVPPAARVPAQRRSGRPSGPSAVGYAPGRDRSEAKRRADAIERACSERGWTVARIVHEGRARDGCGRPGLAFALKQLSQGVGSRLVTCRLEDVGGTRRDLALLLRWCAKRRVDLVALDVGLDTGTSEGRLAARCLLAAGDGTPNGNPPRARAGRKQAAGGANGEKGPAVPS
jgi:peptidoglycan hydrolase-like protein with peptidoglycan-binding domain